MLRRRQAGDTLIEVLFAVTVFSFVVVGALTIMNQGTAASQRSLELTLVRQQIDAQAETLRFMNDSYVAVYQPGIQFNLNDATTTPAEEWYRISAGGLYQDSSAPFTSVQTCPTAPSGSFIVDTRNVRINSSTAILQPSVTFSQLAYNGSGALTASQGLWIEAVRSETSIDANQANAGYVDFYIRSCWEGAGITTPLTIGTIVRLYEPRG